jgi:hypothetical protein
MAVHDFAVEPAASLLGFLEQAGSWLHKTTAEYGQLVLFFLPFFLPSLEGMFL